MYIQDIKLENNIVNITDMLILSSLKLQTGIDLIS